MPFENESFDCVVLCEVIEHLVEDPYGVILKLKACLKPGGLFILSTPNVASLIRVNNLLHGENIYHPYSGFGIYDRHNREYTSKELVSLLEHAGFKIIEKKTSNIVPFEKDGFVHFGGIADNLKSRIDDLGNFVFISAVNVGDAETKRPDWLYDNYPEEQG